MKQVFDLITYSNSSKYNYVLNTLKIRYDIKNNTTV